jgi:hypothetical protein
MPVVQDTKAAVKALGGPVHVARLCGVGRSCVQNWYTRGFPAGRHDMLGGLLRAAGYRFARELFNQRELAVSPRSRKKNGGNK